MALSQKYHINYVSKRDRKLKITKTLAKALNFPHKNCLIEEIVGNLCRNCGKSQFNSQILKIKRLLSRSLKLTTTCSLQVKRKTKLLKHS